MKATTRNRVISFRVTAETYAKIEQAVNQHNQRWRAWCVKNSSLPPWDMSVADYAMGNTIRAAEHELTSHQK